MCTYWLRLCLGKSDHPIIRSLYHIDTGSANKSDRLKEDSRADGFQPLDVPIVYNAPPKPNILFILEVTDSMRNDEDGFYPGMDGSNTSPAQATYDLIKKQIDRYKNSAYFGVNLVGYSYPGGKAVWENYPSGGDSVYTREYSHQISRPTTFVPIADMNDPLKYQNFIQQMDEHYIPGTEEVARGWIPHLYTIYEAAKQFRGEKVVQKVDGISIDEARRKYSAYGENFVQMAMDRGKPTLASVYSPTTGRNSPISYRCQPQHMILVGHLMYNTHDGLYGIVPHDKALWNRDDNILNADGYGLATRLLPERESVYNKKISDFRLLGQVLGGLDLNKDASNLGEFDKSGKKWTDDAEKLGPLKLNFHAIAVTEEYSGFPYSKYLGEITKATGGTYSSDVTSEQKLNDTFDKIIQPLIPPVKHANYLYDQVVITKKTNFYSAQYDPSNWSGEVISYRIKSDAKNELKPGESIELERRSSTAETLSAPSNLTGNLNFQVHDLQYQPQYNVTELHIKDFNQYFNNDLLQWYLAGNNKDGQFRYRATKMDDITTNLSYITPDIAYLNISKYNKKDQATIARYINERTEHFGGSKIIAPSNDGLYNVIRARRDLTRNPLYTAKKGDRIRASLLTSLIDPKRHNADYQHAFVYDGKVTAFDYLYGDIDIAKGTIEDPNQQMPVILNDMVIATLGSGGKGLILGENFNRMYNEHPKTLPAIRSYVDNTMNGWEDLGYSYSAIEFVNGLAIVRPITIPTPQNNHIYLTAYGLIGNGFGGDTTASVAYLFITWPHYYVEGGFFNLKQKIVLNPKGYGAGSPAITIKSHTVKNDRLIMEVGIQTIDKMYIGDYSGGLYRVEFSLDENYTYTDHKVTKIFQDPFGHPITAQPVILTDKAGKDWVFFGTGFNKTAEDKYKMLNEPDTVYHFYGIRDSDLSGQPLGRYTTITHPSSQLLKQEILTETPKKGGEHLDYTETELTLTENARDGKLPAGKLGWYMPLKVKGDAPKGDRIVSPAIYYSGGERVLGIKTWGITPGSDNPEMMDPCFPDTVFSKLLYVDIWTGNMGRDRNNKLVDGTGTEGVEMGDPIGSGVIVGNPSGGGGNINSMQPPNADRGEDLTNNLGHADEICPTGNWVVIDNRLICGEDINRPIIRDPRRLYIKSVL